MLEVGFGYASDGFHHAYVLEAGQDFFAPQKPSGLQPYPADGQQGVPVGWEKNENPDPFPGLSGEIGYPITVFPVHGGSGFVTAQLSLTRVGDTAKVPVAQSPAPRNYAFATAEPLLPGTEYHAALFYTMRNEYDGSETSGVLVWEFTTAGPPPSTTTTATTTTATTTTATTTTTTAPPDPTTTTVPPPASSTTTVPPPAFVDVAGHPYRAAIEAVAAAGIVQGSFDAQGRRIFRPDQPVVRQQFAKMIVEALSLPVSEADVCLFADVDRSGPAELYPDNYVAVAAAWGITRGTTPHRRASPLGGPSPGRR
ncbi:MAG: S-layer homology domain-containing protein [Actinobacteria bacterium]|nr:S-layer homology domain-containing protein [Actinomycetota bacterium]